MGFKFSLNGDKREIETDGPTGWIYHKSSQAEYFGEMKRHGIKSIEGGDKDTPELAFRRAYQEKYGKDFERYVPISGC